MAGYKPRKIVGFEQGLVQDREEFLLVDDAFPVLENAYVWREKVLKKKGHIARGRLRRVLASQSMAVTSAAATYTITDVLATLSLRATEPDAQIQLESFTITFDDGGGSETVLTDAGDGTLTVGAPNNLGATGGTINHSTGAVTVTFAGAIAGGLSADVTFAYYPSLPVMGLKTRELAAVSSEDTIGFDTKYAYQYGGGAWSELVAGTTWAGSDSDFFWTTNFWIDGSNNKLFWAINSTTGAAGDPMRYYNGSTWTSFSPLVTTALTMFQAEVLIPFRGRMLALNTYEGATAGGISAATNYPQRIRWAQIGTPIASDSWQQDVRGKGSFIDIPTSEHITSIAFVRDNLIVFCERSTWQLRYTGRSISPFQVERVNTELGVESKFSSINFDKDVIGVGERRIIRCDSFDAIPVDEKIPDFTVNIENGSNGRKRVYGIRDIQPRLTYWTYPSNEQDEYQSTYPGRVLLYNYENASWSIFKDSFTCFGTTWLDADPTWASSAELTWEEANQEWRGQQADEPIILAGNQQGFVFKAYVGNDSQASLTLTDITGSTTAPIQITIPNHNLAQGDIVVISDIPTGSDFATELNGNTYSVTPTDADTVTLWTYQAATDSWNDPVIIADAAPVGYGLLTILDNFKIVTKKFENLTAGQKIQVGYVDVQLSASTDGEIQMLVYSDYTGVPTNSTSTPFNRRIPTYKTALDVPGATEYIRRVYAQQRGNFLQYELSLSNSQMNGSSATAPVIIHSLILWERLAGRLTV